MTQSADDRPSGSHLPGTQADGSASPVDEAAAWLEATAGIPRPAPQLRAGDDFEREPVEGAGQAHSALGRGGDAGKPRRRAAQAPPEDPVLLGPDADAEEVARKILLDQLTGQARSRAELATKLAKRRVPEEVAERLLDRFEEVGLVDDAAFARLWVESRQPGKGLGRRALAQELRRKGIDEEVARSALAEVEPEDEEEAARELVRRKLRTMRNVDRATATRRLGGMLARKGHSGDIVWRVVREELEARGLEDPENCADLHGEDWSP
ncbi:MAG TPA: regulatory protein RecX [Nocardioidaceae bacterium]|nr:regulatory protein RecX [Nocardioidaceae bacterium]